MDYLERKLCSIYADMQIVTDNIPLFEQVHENRLEAIKSLIQIIEDTLDHHYVHNKDKPRE